MPRITTKQLEALRDRLNRVTGSPASYWNGDKIATGHHTLDWAYSGVKLARICNENGGECDLLSSGYVTKGALFSLLHAYLRGIEAGQALQVAGGCKPVP